MPQNGNFRKVCPQWYFWYEPTYVILEFGDSTKLVRFVPYRRFLVKNKAELCHTMNFIKLWLQNIFQNKTAKLIKSLNKHKVGFSHIAWTEKKSPKSFLGLRIFLCVQFFDYFFKQQLSFSFLSHLCNFRVIYKDRALFKACLVTTEQ